MTIVITIGYKFDKMRYSEKYSKVFPILGRSFSLRQHNVHLKNIHQKTYFIIDVSHDINLDLELYLLLNKSSLF